MADQIEIEKKFLVKNDEWKKCSHSKTPKWLDQGYLFSDERIAARIRVNKMTGEGKFCSKLSDPNLPETLGALIRHEVEFMVGEEDARGLLLQCGDAVVTKHRYSVRDSLGYYWDLDVYEDANSGLVTAEVEFVSAEAYENWLGVEKPSWLGKGITDDPRYLNANLAKNPYKNWKDDEDDGPPAYCPW